VASECTSQGEMCVCEAWESAALAWYVSELCECGLMSVQCALVFVLRQEDISLTQGNLFQGK
jgi:hypothetical protein